MARALAFLLALLICSLCDGRSLTAFLSSHIISPVDLSASIITTVTVPNPSNLATRLFHQSSNDVSIPNGGGRSPYIVYDKVDKAALFKYSVGLATQVSLLFGFFTAVDRILAHFPSVKVPFVANVIFLYAFSLRSSLFSILPNTNSDSEGSKLTEEGNQEYNKRNIPSWTPPGIAFVLGWPLLTFGLRAVTGAMVVQASGGQYASPAIMSLMLHLSLGNLWNTVSNVERRLGVSVVLIYSLWLSKAFAALQFYMVKPLAGKLLALTLTWITAAVALATRTWQINPDLNTGKLEPLVPMQHPIWTTKFRWEQ